MNSAYCKKKIGSSFKLLLMDVPPDPRVASGWKSPWLVQNTVLRTVLRASPGVCCTRRCAQHHCVEWVMLTARSKSSSHLSDERSTFLLHRRCSQHCSGGARSSFLLCWWCVEDHTSILTTLAAPPCVSGSTSVHAAPSPSVPEALLAASQPTMGRNSARKKWHSQAD